MSSAALRLRRSSVLALLVLLLVAGACARRSAVRAPEDVKPQRLDNLKAERTPEGIAVSWGRPTEYAGGGRIDDLAGFDVQRAAGASPRFEKIGTIGIEDLARFRQRKRFTYIDRGIGSDTAWRYRVVSFTSDGYVSDPSNEATVAATN